MALADHRVRALPTLTALEKFLTTEMAAATLIGGDQTFGFTFSAVGETLIVEGTADGGHSWNAFSRLFRVGNAGAHADIAALLAELNTAARWDGGSLPTEFVISNTGNKIVITHATLGPAFGLRVSTISTAIGSVSDEDLLLRAGIGVLGTEYASVGLATVVSIFPDNNGQYIVVYTV